MLIFNPEHDLCLGNGDPNFVAPSSAFKFGEDCSNILEYIVRPTKNNTTVLSFKDDKYDGCISVWGWNQVIKNKLVKKGICNTLLPSDEEIKTIRYLSHRRTAIKAREYISNRINNKFKDYLTPCIPVEITTPEEISPLLAKYGKIVLKAPWSGSGKGLRWAVAKHQDQYTDLKHWCAKTIKCQGSVIAETQDSVIQDFALLFHINKESDSVSRNDVDFIGYSLFRCSNGTYNSNILASDEEICRKISQYIPADLLEEIKVLLTDFLQQEFSYKYTGYLGIDMYICTRDLKEKKSGQDTLPEHSKRYLIQPCVEINVRMTMGLLAHSIFKTYFNEKDSGKYNMSVIYTKDNQKLRDKLATAEMVLTKVDDTTNYAIAIFNE